jgi:hypothetical protein
MLHIENISDLIDKGKRSKEHLLHAPIDSIDERNAVNLALGENGDACHEELVRLDIAFTHHKAEVVQILLDRRHAQDVD